MIKVSDILQGTEEWGSIKAGLPSASCFDRIITTKGEPSKSAKNYIYQLAGERIAGVKTETYQSYAMQRGIEMEEEARAYFELVMGAEVEQVGVIYHDERRFLCSPDGLLPNSGLEIKCPLIHTHVGYLLAGVLPSDYFQQVQGSMLVTGFSHWWFTSYYPGLPALIIDVQRDWDFTAKLKVALDEFCAELDELEKKLRGLA